MTENATPSTSIYYPFFPGTIYSDIIEPIFCMLYLYLIFKIIMSRSDDLKSPYFMFAVATGLSAILNILMNLVTRLVDVRFQIYKDRDLFLNILSSLSHSFALSMTEGKILGVATRYISICHPISSITIWSRKRVWTIIAVQLFVPLALYAYMPFMPANIAYLEKCRNGTKLIKALARTPDCYGHYIGIDENSFKFAKAIGVIGYLLFFVSTIPMCIMSVAKLCSNRKKMAATHGWAKVNSYRNERILAFISVVLTLAHALKATQQTIWFTALLKNDPDLQAFMVSQYMIPNAVTSFAEPILMLISSQSLRREIFGCKPRCDSPKVVPVSSTGPK